MNKVALSVSPRSETGKGPARRLRMAGQAPAIFYGAKVEPVMLAMNIREFKKVLERAGANPIFELQVSDSDRTMNAILKDRQMRPVDGTLVHLDFMQVLMDQPIEVTVALDFEGTAIGVEKGGTFSVVSREMRISCLPDRIPEKIAVDVSGLDIGRSIHVAQITLPEGVTASDPDLTLASVVAPREE